MQDMGANDSRFGGYGLVTRGEFWQIHDFDGRVFMTAETF